MSIALGPLGLLGLLGLGVSTGVAASIDAADRATENAFIAENLRQKSRIRGLEELKARLVRNVSSLMRSSGAPEAYWTSSSR
jgi:hypothetical protein